MQSFGGQTRCIMADVQMEKATREAIDVFDTWRKLIRPIRIAKAWDWNDASNQKPQRCVSRQNDSGRRETERGISLVVPAVLSELFCFLFKLIQTGHFTQIHSFFILVHSEQIVNITYNSLITSYSYTLILIFVIHFYRCTSFSLSFCSV